MKQILVHHHRQLFALFVIHPFIDLEPAYRRSLETGENPFLPYDLHPNAVGMRIAADAVYRAIEKHALLPIQGTEDPEG